MILKLITILKTTVASLLLMKGSFLLLSIVNALLLGTSETAGGLAILYLGLSWFVLPLEILFVLLIILLVIRGTMKNGTDWMKLDGFILSLFIVFAFNGFFLGQVGSLSVFLDLLIALALLAVGLVVLFKQQNYSSSSST